MIKQLTPELVQLASDAGILASLCWSEDDSPPSITSEENVAYLQSQGIAVPQEILDCFTDGSMPPYVPPTNDGAYCDCYPKFIFTHLDRKRGFPVEASFEFRVFGSYFTQSTTITSDVMKVEETEFVNSHEILVKANTLGYAVAIGKLFIDGEYVTQIEVVENAWVDFRDGGTALNLTQLELIGTTDADVVRDQFGLGITGGTTGWAKLIGVPELAISRDHDEGLQLIYYIQDAGAGMFNMTADGHGTDTSMFNETHVGFYVSSQSNYWGYYSAGTGGNSANISLYDLVKAVFPVDMNPGSQFRVYGLKLGDDWADETNLLHQGNIPTNTQDPGTKVYPSLTPNNSYTCRLHAFNPTYN